MASRRAAALDQREQPVGQQPHAQRAPCVGFVGGIGIGFQRGGVGAGQCCFLTGQHAVQRYHAFGAQALVALAGWPSAAAAPSASCCSVDSASGEKLPGRARCGGFGVVEGAGGGAAAARAESRPRAAGRRGRGAARRPRCRRRAPAACPFAARAMRAAQFEQRHAVVDLFQGRACASAS
jgi:hypothetical protein